MLTIEELREFLRVPDYMDDIVIPLWDAAIDYIYVATGASPEQQKDEPLAATATKFLLELWVYGTGCEGALNKQRAIDSMVKALTAKVRWAKAGGVDG